METSWRMALSSMHSESAFWCWAPLLVLSAPCWYWPPPAGTDLPLLVLSTPAGMFVSACTMKSTGCFSWRVIHSYVLWSQAVHLQKQCVLGIVSGYNDSLLQGVWVVCATILSFIYKTHTSPFLGDWWTQLILHYCAKQIFSARLETHLHQQF
jgi:hypothetical protein